MYSDATRDHFLHPRNVGAVPNADGTGTEGTPGEGNFMIVSVRLRDDAIAEAKFQTYGCPGAVAAGSCLTEWVEGMRVADAAQLTATQLDARLGGLPLGRQHCAGLAVGALRKALRAAGRRSAPATVVV